MNKEFKQITDGNEVRYVLEDGGSTTTGAVATVEKPLGELQRRAEPPKPRNFVAKNAKMGGAGQHKDKKKAEKQGSVKHKKPFMEGFNGEYDDEAGMAQSNLLSTARAVMGLLKTIKDKDNLPEWGQEKIAKAEMMLVGVWDYLQSQKQLGNDPQQGVAEAEKKGLYYYVNKRKKAGTSRDASSPKAPSAQAWKDAAKTAKKEGVAEGSGDVVQVHQHQHGKDMGKYGAFNIERETPTVIVVYDHNTGEMLKFNRVTGRGIGPASQLMIRQGVAEDWSKKYKSSINCSHPKGFSQKAHCAGKKKHNEDITMEMVCEDCGMCKTHGNLNEIKKGAKDSNGVSSCWKGYHAAGTKKGKNGGSVRNCVPNEGIAEDPYFNMLERSVSQAQHNLMVGVANNPQFAQKVKVKQRVGQEFAQADQGHDISALPIRVPKKK